MSPSSSSDPMAHSYRTCTSASSAAGRFLRRSRGRQPSPRRLRAGGASRARVTTCGDVLVDVLECETPPSLAGAVPRRRLVSLPRCRSGWSAPQRTSGLRRGFSLNPPLPQMCWCVGVSMYTCEGQDSLSEVLPRVAWALPRGAASAPGHVAPHTHRRINKY